MKQCILLTALSVVVMLATATPCHAGTSNANAFPGCPEIEALISMHKTLYSDAVKSANFEAVTVPVNEQKKSLQTKWQETREVINQRLDQASQWVSLTTLMATTSLDVVNLTKEFADFIAEAQPLIARNPTAAYEYYRAYSAISQEIKRMKEVVVVNSLSMSSILKGTLSQKFKVLYSLSASISLLRGTIRNTLWRCRWLLGDKVEIVHIRRILEDKELQGYAKSAISWWESRNKDTN